ncbi:MAG: hypothetical protein JW830_11800 [Bacteroidales bacterium]|nr:hypothetical protein [Bacteroidales bacterium]
MNELDRARQVGEREYLVGETRAMLLDDHIIKIEIIGPQPTEDAYALYNATRKLEKLVNGKVSYLIDLNRAGKNSSEASRLWKRATEEKNVYKVAQFGLHPVAKVLASFVNSLNSNNHNIRFFSSMEEGLQWIQE